MPKSAYIIPAILVLGLGFYGISKYSGGIGGSDEYSRVASEAYNFSFEYREKPNGYILIATDSGYTLMLRSDFEELEGSEIPREGPPTINIQIYENTAEQDAATWIDTNPYLSNINLLIGEIDTDNALGGLSAVRYRADGLYASDIVVVTTDKTVYLFSGSFITENSQIRTDYTRLLASVEFDNL